MYVGLMVFCTYLPINKLPDLLPRCLVWGQGCSSHVTAARRDKQRCPRGRGMQGGWEPCHAVILALEAGCKSKAKLLILPETLNVP